ncbi:hypothetical protein [Streptomyces sp. NPDC060333]|uniref:hypothetical protein n=1 Tax=Streptomyces sp. NPDC060333 TaxID=3347098 RepID=UPI0036570736
MQQTKTPLGHLVLVLAAVHAVPLHELRTILTGDLDLARGTLVIRRGLRRHTLYLEELTHQTPPLARLDQPPPARQPEIGARPRPPRRR